MYDELFVNLQVFLGTCVQVTEYEYDAAMEEHYRASLFKSFNKTLDDGYFPVVVIDAINHKVRS